MLTNIRGTRGPYNFDQRSAAVRQRQIQFEQGPVGYYLTPAARTDALEIHQARLVNARFYLGQSPPDHWNAAIEFSRAARILEMVVIYPHRDRLVRSITGEENHDWLKRALDARSEAVKYLRLNLESHKCDGGPYHELAVELGNLAHVLIVLRDNYPGGPDSYAQLIALRSEAAAIFARQGDHYCAFHEYNRLVILFKQALDHANCLAAAEAALRHARQHAGEKRIAPLVLGQLRQDLGNSRYLLEHGKK